jgi:hypothetical protein
MLTLMSTTTCTEGRWVHVDTIHGNVDVMRCNGCGDRMVIRNGRHVDVPASITGRKAIIRWIRSQAAA